MSDKLLAAILKQSLTIVDELAKIDIDEIKHNDVDYDNLDDLIKKAKQLKKSSIWKLK